MSAFWAGRERCRGGSGAWRWRGGGGGRATVNPTGTIGDAYGEDMSTPRRLGLLGGVTWHSSLEYERLINEGINKQLGGVASGDLLVRSYNFADIAAAQESGDWARLAQIFSEDAAGMADAGAEGIVICANTMHKIAAEVAERSGLPVIDIRDAVADAVLAQGRSTVSLFATAYTMRERFYIDHLARRGVTALVPEEPHLSEVHRVIYEELAQGVVLPESRETIKRLASELAEHGSDGFIAGCTEIPMLVTAADVEGPYFDALALHAEAAVRFALEDTRAT